MPGEFFCMGARHCYPQCQSLPFADKALALTTTTEYIKLQIKEGHMELLGILGIVVLWYVLNRWILPRFGVQT